MDRLIISSSAMMLLSGSLTPPWSPFLVSNPGTPHTHTHTFNDSLGSTLRSYSHLYLAVLSLHNLCFKMNASIKICQALLF